MSSLQPLIDAANRFRDERDWRQFHTPKDLALSLTLEAAEVLEHFQWKNGVELEAYLKNGGAQALSKELADVLSYLLYLADDLGIDLERALREKFEENARKYPVEKARGRSDKYTAYREERAAP